MSRRKNHRPAVRSSRAPRRRRPRGWRAGGRVRSWPVWAAAACLLVLLPFAVPRLPPLAARGWQGIEEAVRVARRAEAEERELRRYARHYGIPPELAAAVHRAARAEGMDPELAFRLVRVESAFREQAESPVGALGLTQLMPSTAAELQPGITREEILQRDTNLRLGFRYFRRLLRYYGGSVDLALHAYNRGLGTVDRIRAGGGDPANGYASRVLGPPGASRVRAGLDTAPVAPPLHEMAPARWSDD